MSDMNGKPIHEGDSVQLYYKGEFVSLQNNLCSRLGNVLSSMADGYKNKFPMDPEKFQVV